MHRSVYLSYRIFKLVYVKMSKINIHTNGLNQHAPVHYKYNIILAQNIIALIIIYTCLFVARLSVITLSVLFSLQYEFTM